MPDWFPWVIPFVDTLHIKDAIEAERRVVKAGDGDGELLEGLKAMVEAGWSGPLTIEPHLSAAGPFGGFSGEDLFEVAVTALRSVAAEAGVVFSD